MSADGSSPRPGRWVRRLTPRVKGVCHLTSRGLFIVDDLEHARMLYAAFTRYPYLEIPCEFTTERKLKGVGESGTVESLGAIADAVANTPSHLDLRSVSFP